MNRHMQTSRTADQHIKIKPLHLIFWIIVLQLIIAFFTDGLIFTHEEAMWHYIGRNWLRFGLTPYAGGVDNKSPLIYFIFGISDRLFGVNDWFPRLLGTLVEAVGIFFLFKIAERRMNYRAGIFAVSIYGLSLLWHSTGGKYVSFTETYAVSFILASLYTSQDAQNHRHLFFSGLLSGIAFAFRFSAVFGIIPLAILNFRRHRTGGYWFLAGLTFGIGLFMLFMVFSGIRLHDFLFYGFSDNFGSGSPTGLSSAWKAQQFANGFFYSELILFYPAVAVYFLMNRKFDFLKGWLICECAGIIILGIFARNHFKNLLPCLSLISACVVERLTEKYPVSPNQIILGIWIVFFPKTFEPLFAVKKLFNLKKNQSASGLNSGEEYSKKLLGNWIRNNTQTGDKVFVGGYGAQIQVYAERLSPSVYFNVTQTAPAKKKLFSDLGNNKPSMMVIPQSADYIKWVDVDIRIFLDSLAGKEYRLDTALYHYNIFRLRKPVH